MNKKIISLGEKPLLSVSDWVFREQFSVSKKICLIVSPEIDLELIENTFLEWQKVFVKCFNNKDEVKIITFGKQIGKEVYKDNFGYENCYDDVLSILDLQEYVITNLKDKLLFITKQNFLDLNINYNLEKIKVKLKEKIEFDNFILKLTDFGYRRVSNVESLGEFSTRGNIIDIWPNSKQNQRKPYRIIFDENIVNEIKEFDIATQRSLKFEDKRFCDEIVIYPVVVKCLNIPKNNNLLAMFDIIIELNDQFPSSIDILDYQKNNRYFGVEKLFFQDYNKYKVENYDIVIGYNFDYELNKLKEILREEKSVTFCNTELCDGFYNTKIKLFFTTYSEILSKFEYYHKPKKTFSGINLESFWEIQPQDYVVHKDYGVGKFLGIEKIFYGEKTGEFLTILYKDNAKLYVPITEFNKVEKFVSIGQRVPQLSSLDKVSWKKNILKIKKSLKEFVVELYKIYSLRKKVKGIKYCVDTDFEKQLEESFIYNETTDQLNAINDVKKDLCSGFPMDRIIVGDVGFGKTEVAIRAAFKSVMNGRQVLILCPTTILAEQHYRTFVDRLSAFAVNIGIITRLQKKSYVDEVMKNISENKIDIVIGTHALLNDKIKFANLGLVIIDEEHKFGVKHKEKIRLKYRQNEYIKNDLFFVENKSLDLELKNVDYNIPHVLSLTATPIPRTLSTALQGIKDISVIETPPEGRLPIETFILPYNVETIYYAINRELHRNGQVYYLFNNISLIEHKTNILKKFFPKINIEYIHSKLSAKKIEDIMLNFVENKIQVLVTTTIIESGLDMPNVNTIIIEDVDKYGLAQLYQLRGRVGRRDIKAYSYFMYDPEHLTLNAKKRLAALTEFSSLGSGYKLALRDLEIRGAGELLGTKQHGVINEIGLSMYSNIIQEILNEISYEQGIDKIVSKSAEPLIELNIDAYIPLDYVSDNEIRIVFYRKILNSKTFAQLEDVYEELIDRFGKIKKENIKTIKNLFDLAKLKIILKQHNIEKFTVEEDKIQISFFDFESLEKFFKNVPKDLRNNFFIKDNKVFLNSKFNNIDDLIKTLSPVRVERTT